MALKLDNTLLEELGLGALPDAEKQLLLRQIYEKLEMNVGMRLADQMSNEQLDAFEKFVDANDDKGAFQWLESNFPNYKSVVNEEFEKLKQEIRTVAPQILASAQQQASASNQQGQVAPGAPSGQAPASETPPASPHPGQSHPPQQYGQSPGGMQPQPQYSPPASEHAQSQPRPTQPPQQHPQPQHSQPNPMPQHQPAFQPAQFAAPPPSQGTASPAGQHLPPTPPPFPTATGAVPQNGHLQPQYGGAPGTAPMPQQPAPGSPPPPYGPPPDQSSYQPPQQ